MQFGLSAEQRLLEESVRRMCEEIAPLDKVRELAADRDPAAPALVDALVELGVPGLLIGEEDGGVGLSLVDAAVVARTLGAAVAPVPFTAAYVMAPLGIRLAGSDAQQRAWLPEIADGTTRFGVAVSEWIGAREDAGVTASGSELSGRALAVLDGVGATDYLIAAAGPRLFRVAADAVGLDVRPMRTIDRTRGVAELHLDGVAAEILPGSDAATMDAMVHAGRVMLAADTVGAARTMLDRAVAYAAERRQFGRAIGSFQAVKHMCAEMAAELEPCEALVWYAAYALESLPDEGPLAACHVKAHTGEVGRFVAKTATEVHGGMGFTDLLGLHYWFKRIGADRQWLGGPEQVREHAARLQGWVAT